MRRGKRQSDPSLDIARLVPSAVLRRLELTIVRKLEGFLHGEHLGLLPGPGTDLAEARVYRPGEDDVRRMDWAVTARTTTPHVRDVIADRELETWALVDMSASMEFGTAAMQKRELAVAAVGTIGFLTQRLGDRFGGFVVRHGRLRRWPPRSGRLALYALLRSLVTDTEPTAGTKARPQPDDFGSALEQMSRGYQRRGLRIVVSDFLDGAQESVRVGPDVPPPWERAMKRLSGRHQVLAIEVSDPRERELPNVGVVWLTDPETGVSREVDTGDRRTRELFTAAAALHRQRVQEAFRRAGVAHLVLSTERDWVTDLAGFVFAHRRTAARLHAPHGRGVG